jgi:hypothetical protein
VVHRYFRAAKLGQDTRWAQRTHHISYFRRCCEYLEGHVLHTVLLTRFGCTEVREFFFHCASDALATGPLPLKKGSKYL